MNRLSLAFSFAIYLLIGAVIAAEFTDRINGNDMTVVDFVIVTLVWPFLVLGSFLP